MPDRLTKLRDLTITRVAFVPRGDNPEAHVLLWKSDRSEQDITKDGGQMEKAPTLTPRRVSRLREAWESLGTLIEEAGGRKEEQMTEPADKQYQLPDDSPEELKKFVDALTKERDDAVAELATKNDPEPAPEPEPAEDALAKADPAVQEVVKTLQDEMAKARADATAASEEVAKLREERATAEAIERAKAFSHLASDATKLGKTLREIEKASPDAAAEVERLLGSADTAAVFAEIGQGGSPSAESPIGKLNAMAAEIAKRDGISEAVAFNKAIETTEGKRLHREYQEEKGEVNA